MKKDEYTELAGIEQDEFVICVDSILDTLVSAWKFGYFDEEDIRQEGHILALKAIRSGRYDKTKNLRSFLYICLNNGLFNLKRNVTGRFASPCERCPLYDKKYAASKNQCLAFENKLDCKKLSDWHERNTIRSSLINATPFSTYDDINDVGIEYADVTSECYIIDEITKNEIAELINKNLSPQLRGIFLKMMANISVKISERHKVQEAIYIIIKSSGLFTNLLESLEYGKDSTR